MTKIRDREQVVDVAARVFADRGFEAARLEDIAAELGVLQGSLYYHISSKAELLLLVQQRRLKTIAARVREIAASDAPPVEKLALAIGEHIAHLERYYPESAQWFTTPSRADARGAEDSRLLNREYTATWVELVRHGISEGSFRADLDPRVVARGILGMANWLPRWYQRDGSLPMDEIARMLTAMVTGGLAPALPQICE